MAALGLNCSTLDRTVLVKNLELFAQSLDDVGINVQLKEVTSDEYRAK
jgi:hypothetical protein